MDDRQIAALAKGLVPFVREVVTDAVTPLVTRLAALEQRTPEKGEKGEPGESIVGPAGKDGTDAVSIPGPPGERGLKGDPGESIVGPAGKDGRDGRDAGDLTLLKNHIGELVVAHLADVFRQATFISPDHGRTLQFSLAGVEHEVKTATPLDRGVWREGAYQRGDTVSHGGSMWVAQAYTETKPDTVDCHWRLAVKRGRDGKDGKQGERGAKGEAGTQGPRGDRAFGI